MASQAWEREMAYIKNRAGVPRAMGLGCVRVSHEHLEFCAFCVRAVRDGGPNGVDLEVNAWRLLAMKEKAL